MSNAWLQFGLIVLLTLANGFFAASEIAVVSARRGRLQQRAESGSRGAAIALDLTEQPNRFLSTVQVGISLISVFTAAFGGSVLAEPIARTIAPIIGAQYAQMIALTLVVLLITYLSLILGELVPKRLALQNAEAIASYVAPVMRLIAKLAAPIVWFLTISTQAVLTLLGRGNQPEEQVTEEDVLSLVREGTEGGAFEASEQTLIQRVFEFTDATARSIMTPRTEIVALAVETPLPEAAAQVIESGFSRIPVYRGSLDTIEGIIYAKDLLGAIYNSGTSGTHTRLADLLRPPVFVLEHQRIGSVLQQLKQTRTHLALVLDEYGQIEGLITLEDVLEELTGDIADEYDEAETMLVRRADGSWLVDGRVAYGDAEERIGLPSREELPDLPPFDTVAGLMLALLEHIPTAGETAALPGWQLEVVDMDGVRIDKVLIQGHAPINQQQTEGSLALGAVLPPPEQSERTQPPQKTNGQD